MIKNITGLGSSITHLKGAGPRIAEKLERLGINTIQDLLFHCPFRYQDRSNVKPISGLYHDQEALIGGEVIASRLVYGRRRMLLVTLADSDGVITLRFFHFNAGQQASFKVGTWVSCFGVAKKGANGFEMVHPEYDCFQNEQQAEQPAQIVPIYPTTDGVHQRTFRKLIAQALVFLEVSISSNAEGDDLGWDPPGQLMEEAGLPTIYESLLMIHAPSLDLPYVRLESGELPGQQRLIFDELLAFHLSLRQLREKKKSQKAMKISEKAVLANRLIAGLPYSLTTAQHRVHAEITTDMKKLTPMQRLVQGDVGCGKTIMAALAAAHVVELKYQAAVMAPTELLAEQHAINFEAWFEPLGLKVGLLSGKLTGKKREVVLKEISNGALDVVIGTHALFQQDVIFSRLGLVVIDEQHRFGVHQRLALREKGQSDGCFPHQLIMTATPIPRTLAMTAYADLDISIVDELPPGRRPIKTVVIPENRRIEVVERVRLACAEGQQAYWVCPLIDESDLIQSQAATTIKQELQSSFPELRIGLVHGRMKSAEKEQVMGQFKQGELDLLVATTVIEVGVDVANASLMIIENSERMGLSQLHQLRGRVGRGGNDSSCILLYHGRLSEIGKQRLAVLRETQDGFKVAQKDMELRGAGELLGLRQTGVMQMKMANVVRDQHLIPQVAKVADKMLRDYPDYVPPTINRWLSMGSQYGEV